MTPMPPHETGAAGPAFKVRLAQRWDAEDVARVHVAAWRDTYAGVLPTAYLVNLDQGAHARRWRALLAHPDPQRPTFVAETPDRQILGYGSCGPARGRTARADGEIYALYVDPAVQEAGVGKGLVAAMAQALHDAGIGPVCVWVLRDNPNRWFYHWMGGEPVAEAITPFAGESVAQVAYRWNDAHELAAGARV